MQVYTDVMDRKHLPQIIAIEQDTAEPLALWAEEDFLRELAGPNTTGRVALGAADEVLGFIVYEVCTKKFHILHLGVSPQVEAALYFMVIQLLLSDLTKKVQSGGRVAVTFSVRERNVALQKVLAKCGFHAFKVRRGFFVDTDEDAFLFKFEREVAKV